MSSKHAKQSSCMVISGIIDGKKKIAKNNIMYFCFSCISYLSFGTEIAHAGKPKRNRVTS